MSKNAQVGPSLVQETKGERIEFEAAPLIQESEGGDIDNFDDLSLHEFDGIKDFLLDQEQPKTQLEPAVDKIEQIFTQRGR